MTTTPKADQPKRLSATCSERDGIRVVALRGELDHDVQDVAGQALLSEDGRAPLRTVVDLSGVTFMDSSGINVLVAAHQQAAGSQGWLRIAAAQDSVLRVMQIVGLDHVIDCHSTLEQALTA
ncbi:STAS domain-containing protein [Streptomyces sp. NPDC054842]